jgi:hypothetical protein
MTPRQVRAYLVLERQIGAAKALHDLNLFTLATRGEKQALEKRSRELKREAGE